VLWLLRDVITSDAKGLSSFLCNGGVVFPDGCGEYAEYLDWITHPVLVNGTVGIYSDKENTYRQARIMLFNDVLMGEYRTFSRMWQNMQRLTAAVWSYDSLDFHHYVDMVNNQKLYYMQG
jgi:hypothetical protein